MNSNKLWYGADEVRIFHTVVKESINKALMVSNLSDKYYTKHHYGQYTNGIPDFVLLDKQTNDFVCVIEVKKTPGDTLGQEAGNQTKNYVKQLFPLRWKVGYRPNFCVTNLEYTQFYGLRENTSLIGCLLQDSPKFAALIDSEEITSKFTEILAEYFMFIDNKSEHKFSMHLETISESFNKSFYNVAEILGANFNRISNFVNVNEDLRRGVLYELFRFAFYYYIKEYYTLSDNPLAKHFADFESSELAPEELVGRIDSNFGKVMEIDFADLLKNYTSDNPVFPNKVLLNEDLANIFNNFIQTLEDNASQGINQNSSLLNYTSLITSEIYDKKEMHSTGKIMSDEVLSDILANFTIQKSSDTVLDPCCGDGNLLTAAYKRKKQLNNCNEYGHNQILSEINGIDIDPNLIQLSAFRLIGQDLNSVSTDTYTKLKARDFIDDPDTNVYDSVVMNPPYLRNEDLNQDDKGRWINSIESTKGSKSFIRDVSQPNQYYYFIEKAIQKISEDGQGAFILMSKFLNNKDGSPLKEYLIPYLEAVIHYPPLFFKGFAVTTDIFIVRQLSKAASKVSFLNIKDTSMLANVDSLKKIISSNVDVTDSKEYSIVNINKVDLDSKSNWRLYLIDPENKFHKFTEIYNMVPIGTLFSFKRGQAGNRGGCSDMVFPFSPKNPLSDLVKNIEPEYISPGLLRNKLAKGRRKFQLTDECLLASKGIKVPDNVLSENLHDLLDPGIRNYLVKMRSKLGDDKFKNALKDTISSQMLPDIIIPRGDRKKHAVYYYRESAGPALISTNFFALNYLNTQNIHGKSLSIKFVVAFLISSFGQLQFEIHANNQEGNRKLEGERNIEKFRIIDPDSLSQKDINYIVNAFDTLDELNVDFLGTEEMNLRDELDSAISKVLFKENKLGFSTTAELKDFSQNFLRELVDSR